MQTQTAFMEQDPVPYRSLEPGVALPSPHEVRQWWERHGMLDNIRAHSEVVCRVALRVADWLAEAGVMLNRQAVEVGALAHDLAKTPCLGTKLLHSVEGQRLLEELGYPELGYLVRRHVFLPPGHPLDETMVVNYADKRVKHDQVVDLNQRFDYILRRYGHGDPERIRRIEEGRRRAFEVQATIFEPMQGRHTPGELDRLWREGRL